MVQHVCDRQFQTEPLPDLARVGAAGVDHLRGLDIPLHGMHDETIAGARYTGDPVVPNHRGAHHARSLGHGEGDAGRIDMAVVRRIQRCPDAVEIIKRVQLGDAPGVDDFHFVTETLAHRQRVANPVDLVRGIGDAQAAATVPGAGLAGLVLEERVQLGTVSRHLREAVVADRMRDLAGGVPGRTAGQFRLLQQQDVGFALLAEVIGE